MKITIPTFLILLAAALFAACGDHHDEDGHGHGDGHEEHHHDGEDHDHEHDDHDHGEREELGSAKIGDASVTVAVFGEIEAGHEAVLDIEVEGLPVSTVRAWVGISSGRGSLKGLIEGKDGEYHGHVEVPATLPEGSAVWVELESEGGKKAQASFKLHE